MYFADSPRHKIWAFDYDAASRLSGRLVRRCRGLPVERRVGSATNPTCCCFGGTHLDTLYITSAKGAGLFAAVPGVNGLAESRFG